MRLKKMLPSPAMVIACLALVAAIGGSAYAASKINGKTIKSNTVTGKQIKESTVKNVASAKTATTADSATTADTAKTADSATDATTVGGQKPEDLGVRWLLLNEQGQIEDQSGGFTVLDAYDTNANAYIDAGETLVGKGLTASIAIQNQIDLDPATMGIQGNFGGEVSVTRCQIAGVVECAPANAKNVNALVVSPRNSDGTANAIPSPGTGPGTATKRVYVQITE